MLARVDGDVVAAARSGQDGSFVLTGPFRSRVAIEARRSGYYPSDATRTLDCSGASCGPVDLELVLGGVVSVRVEDDFGEPMSNVQATATRIDGERSRSLTGRSDDRGEVRIAGLRAGRYRVEFSVPVRGLRDAVHQALPVELEVASGQEERLSVTARLNNSSLFSVSGVVAGVDFTQEGRHMLRVQPARQQRNRGRRRRFSSWSRSLGPDGEFLVPDLPAGRYAFSYSSRTRRGPGRSDDIPLGVLEIDGPRTGLTLTPLPPSGIRGSLSIDAKELPESLSIALIPQGEEGRNTFLTADGPAFSFARESLFPGEYRMRISMPRGLFVGELLVDGKRASNRRLRFDAGTILDVQAVVSDRYARIRGRVKARPHALAVTEVRYRVALRGPEGMRIAEADQFGVFEFLKVVPGDYRIAAWANASQTEARTAERWKSAGEAVRAFPVETGGDVELDITAAP